MRSSAAGQPPDAPTRRDMAALPGGDTNNTVKAHAASQADTMPAG